MRNQQTITERAQQQCNNRKRVELPINNKQSKSNNWRATHKTAILAFNQLIQESGLLTDDDEYKVI